MKLKVLLSIFFVIATTFSAIHELQHIEHNDDLSCQVYHVNDNLTSVDTVDEVKDIEIFHLDYISQNSSISTLHVKDKSNPNRAPPSLS